MMIEMLSMANQLTSDQKIELSLQLLQNKTNLWIHLLPFQNEFKSFEVRKMKMLKI